MKALSCLGRLIALFFALLFALSLTAWVVGVATEGVLLQSESYKRAFLARRLYDQLPTALAGSVAQNDTAFLQGFLGPAAFFVGDPTQNLGPADYEVMLRSLLTSSWLQTETESLVDQAFAYLESDEPLPSLNLSLLEPKERLAGPAGRDILLQIISAQPACGEDPLIATLGCAGWLASAVWCRPPDNILAECSVALEATAFGAAALGVPDEVDLVAVGGPDLVQGLAQARQYSEWLRIANRIGWLVPLAFLFAVAIFAARSLRGWLGWWGITLGMGAVALLVGALAAWQGSDWVVAAVIQQAPLLTLISRELLFDIGQELAQQMAIWLLAAGIFAGFSGLGMLVAGALIPGRDQHYA